jgi:hypothetical protein
MKETMGKTNKKVIGVALAGIITLGSIGGGAYAYKDEWTAKIQEGVSQLANHVFGGAIQTAVDEHGETKEGQLKGEANKLINGVMNDLKAFKQSEIDRGKAELDAKYNSDVDKITRVANNAKEAEKAEQRAKTNTAVSEAKSEMDAVIEEYLSQIK